MKNKGIYLLKNALFFCISKGIAFLAPLLFVKFVTLEEYGEVEFALQSVWWDKTCGLNIILWSLESSGLSVTLSAVTLSSFCRQT